MMMHAAKTPKFCSSGMGELIEEATKAEHVVSEVMRGLTVRLRFSSAFSHSRVGSAARYPV